MRLSVMTQLIEQEQYDPRQPELLEIRAACIVKADDHEYPGGQVS